MTFILEHVRTQRPVGQGGFHSAALKFEGKQPFRYVYDCGAVRGEIDREVDGYILELKQNKNIDAVFISHFHEDHINGLSRLLDTKKGARAERLFIPLLDSIERLIAIAPSMESGQSSSLAELYFVSGGQALGSLLNVGRIYEVRPAIDQAGSPGAAQDGSPSVEGDFNPETGLEVSLTNLDGLPASSNELDDTHAMFIGAPNGRRLWEFRWHVNRLVKSQRERFLSSLRRSSVVLRYAAGRPIDEWLSDPAARRDLMTSEDLKREVVAAYSTIRKNLNLINLSLYSGPLGTWDVESWSPRRLSRFDERFTGDFFERLPLPSPVGWLGTGDAKLSTSNKCRELSDHFGDRLRTLATFMVPHHGSTLDMSSDLLGFVRSDYAVIPFGTGNTYGHPGRATVVALVHKGIVPIFVAERASTIWEERFRLSQ